MSSKRRKLYAEEIEEIMTYKERRGEFLNTDDLKDKTKISTYTIGKLFNVSHQTIFKIWNNTYEWQKIPIDVKLAEKIIKFFANKEVRENIPTEKKEEFFTSLTEVEKKRVGQIIEGY